MENFADLSSILLWRSYIMNSAVGRSARAQQAHKVTNRINLLMPHTQTDTQIRILGLPRASSGRQKTINALKAPHSSIPTSCITEFLVLPGSHKSMECPNGAPKHNSGSLERWV